MRKAGEAIRAKNPRRSRSRYEKHETKPHTSCEQEERKRRYIHFKQYILILNDENSHIHTILLYEKCRGTKIGEGVRKKRKNKKKKNTKN